MVTVTNSGYERVNVQTGTNNNEEEGNGKGIMFIKL